MVFRLEWRYRTRDGATTEYFVCLAVVGDVILSHLILFWWFLNEFTDWLFACALFSFNFSAFSRIHSRKEPFYRNWAHVCHSIRTECSNLLCSRANQIEWRIKMELESKLESRIEMETGETLRTNKKKIASRHRHRHALESTNPYFICISSERGFWSTESVWLVVGIFRFIYAILFFRLLRSYIHYWPTQYSQTTTTQPTKIYNSNEAKLFHA